jgi:hypothetical protein
MAWHLVPLHIISSAQYAAITNGAAVVPVLLLLLLAPYSQGIRPPRHQGHPGQAQAPAAAGAGQQQDQQAYSQPVCHHTPHQPEDCDRQAGQAPPAEQQA